MCAWVCLGLPIKLEGAMYILRSQLVQWWVLVIASGYVNWCFEQYFSTLLESPVKGIVNTSQTPGPNLSATDTLAWWPMQWLSWQVCYNLHLIFWREKQKEKVFKRLAYGCAASEWETQNSNSRHVPHLSHSPTLRDLLVCSVPVKDHGYTLPWWLWQEDTY